MMWRDETVGVATLTITEFLLARIAEDRVRATLRDWHTSDCDTIPNASGYSYPCDCGVPERMTREANAMQQIVEAHPIASDFICHDPKGASFDYGCETCHFDECGYVAGLGACPTLKALASVYADHPDYREEWRS